MGRVCLSRVPTDGLGCRKEREGIPDKRSGGGVDMSTVCVMGRRRKAVVGVGLGISPAAYAGELPAREGLTPSRPGPVHSTSTSILRGNGFSRRLDWASRDSWLQTDGKGSDSGPGGEKVSHRSPAQCPLPHHEDEWEPGLLVLGPASPGGGCGSVGFDKTWPPSALPVSLGTLWWWPPLCQAGLDRSVP